MEKRLIKIQEAADMLGVSRAKFYQLISRGVIRSVKIDGSRRIPVMAIDEFVAQLEVDAYDAA